MKSFAELQLEICRKETKRRADDLLWQLSNGGIDNIHVLSTAQALIHGLNTQAAWVAVVGAENCGTPYCERNNLESHVPKQKFKPGDLARAKKHVKLTGNWDHMKGEVIKVTEENVGYFNSAHENYTKPRRTPNEQNDCE